MRARALLSGLLLVAMAAPAHAGGDLDYGGFQVLLKVELVEVSRSRSRDLGVDFPLDLEDGGPTVRSVPRTIGGDTLVQKMLEDDRAQVISEPRLVTLERQQASFFVGGDLTVEGQTFREVGIKLDVTPQVEPESTIVLDIRVDVDQFAGTVEMPKIVSRTVNTRVPILDGNLAVIGNLFRRQTRETAGRVPWLGNLPVLGALFSQREFQRGRQHLLIFVTPRITGEAGRGGTRTVPRNPLVTHPKPDPNVKSPQYPQSPQYPAPKTSPGYSR